MAEAGNAKKEGDPHGSTPLWKNEPGMDGQDKKEHRKKFYAFDTEGDEAGHERRLRGEIRGCKAGKVWPVKDRSVEEDKGGHLRPDHDPGAGVSLLFGAREQIVQHPLIVRAHRGAYGR